MLSQKDLDDTWRGLKAVKIFTAKHADAANKVKIQLFTNNNLVVAYDKILLSYQTEIQDVVPVCSQ